MQVTLLGTGAPWSSRAATGMVVSADGCDPLVIDTCGGFEFVRQLDRAGINARSLRNIIATHRHLDHIGGLPPLLMVGKMLDWPLDIYGLEDTHQGIQQLMAATFPEVSLHHDVRFLAVGPGEHHEIGGFSVSFFAADHRVPTVAVRVEHAGKTLAFSADSRPCAPVVACARGADLFLCDALVVSDDAAALAEQLMHPTAREAGMMAAEAEARTLVLVHILSDAPAERLQADAEASFTGRVIVGEDLTTYAV